MLNSYLTNFETKCVFITEKVSQYSTFPTRLALFCSLIVFITGGDAIVSVIFGYNKIANSDTWQFLQQQIISPFTTFSEHNHFHHTAKMTYRLFPAYLGKLCWNCSLKFLMFFYIILEYITGTLFFYFSYKLLKKYNNDSISITWIVTGICFTFLGKIFFWDTYAYFDAFALFFLLLSLFVRNPLLLSIFLFLAFWTDERSIVASGLVWVWWTINDKKSSANDKFFRPSFWVPSLHQWVILGTVIFTFILRYYLTIYYHIPSVINISGMLSETYTVLFNKRLIEIIPLVTISSFESYWLYITIAFVILKLNKENIALFIYISALAASFGVSFLVYDMSRSTMYAFPAIFIALRLIMTELPSTIMRRMALYVLIIAAIFPTYYLSHYMWPFFIRILRFNL